MHSIYTFVVVVAVGVVCYCYCFFLYFTGGHLSYTVPASERVKFILGGEEEKQVQETPQLFTELEELFVYLDGNTEWKETARW